VAACWRPTASFATLGKRADLLARTRSFFAGAGVMEVDTPLLGATGVTDLHIDCIEAQVRGATGYLQSSPEYFMKRLLAAGSGPIYSLGKVFRDGEKGRRHRPEFTLLEWYRPGWDEYRLMTEVAALFTALFAGQGGAALAVTHLTYGEAFSAALDIDPHGASTDELAACAVVRFGEQWRAEPRGTLLDLLFSLVVEPSLPGGLVFICEYPACQAALARLGKNAAGQTVARRFEVFLDRMELGNGYFELSDAQEQRDRFEQDLARRAAANRKQPPIDEALLAALTSGLPECAGVAIGMDRLLMKLLGVDDIAEVVAFSPV